MKLDFDKLKKASEKIQSDIERREPKGVAGLLAGIHKGELGRWTTIESSALAPVPGVQGGRWVLVSLLAIPASSTSDSPRLRAPWGAITWSGTDLVVSNKICLSDHDEVASIVTTLEPFPYTPHPPNMMRLCKGLDRLLSLDASRPHDLSGLARAYQGLLPTPVRGLIHTLLPSCQTWLPADEDGNDE